MIKKATEFAMEKHDGQKDDCGKDYFISHLLPVRDAVRELTDDNDIICAAVLHDSLEDTDTTYEELMYKFNKRIADLVMEVTQEGKKDSYGYYFPRLKTAGGILIKLIDRASNISRMDSWSEERKAQYLKKSIFSKQFPKFNRLTVISKVLNKKTHQKVLCRCDCGNEKVIRLDHLNNGETQSCGCLQKEKASQANKIHGITHSPTYSSWSNMKDRCNNLKNINYKNYGGRGITYSSGWNNFVKFLEDMGEKPINRSLDRINNNEGYSKTNCRWATMKQQANNKRSNRILIYQGKKKNMCEWAEEFGMEYHKFAQHLKYYDRVVNGVLVKEFWKSEGAE